jgi:hypothetical protein
MMHQDKHAQAMADRFRELVESAGDSLPDSHYDELKLIIESGLDAALIESMEKIAMKLESMAREIKHDVETES